MANHLSAAMPEMTRTWVIPASHTHPELKFEIREPPLTGDNLGFKTWGTAFAISKKLEELGSRFFHHLIHGVEDNVACEAGSNPMMSRMRVLEYVVLQQLSTQQETYAESPILTFGLSG